MGSQKLQPRTILGKREIFAKLGASSRRSGQFGFVDEDRDRAGPGVFVVEQAGQNAFSEVDDAEAAWLPGATSHTAVREADRVNSG